MNEQVRGIGDNLGAIPGGEILREYLADSNAALIHRRDELIEAAGRIPEIDDNVARLVTDFVRQVTACAKAAEGARVAAKEPYLEGSRAVDGFYRMITDPLDKVKREVERRLTVYLRAKAEAERREREERARVEREEAERSRREAEEAERRLADENSLRQAIVADARAKEAEANRVKAEREAQAKAADLSRTRGEFGAVSSLRTYWTFADIDRDALDLEALRAHLPIAGLEAAVRSFVRAGGRELRGVRIFETTDAVVR